jgi:hypothetical protein
MTAFPPGSLFNPGWFRVPSGVDKGQLRISAWTMSAVELADGGWMGIASCPICHALVMNDDSTNNASREVRSHERWHARNDFPIPPELDDGDTI